MHIEAEQERKSKARTAPVTPEYKCTDLLRMQQGKMATFSFLGFLHLTIANYCQNTKHHTWEESDMYIQGSGYICRGFTCRRDAEDLEVRWCQTRIHCSVRDVIRQGSADGSGILEYLHQQHPYLRSLSLMLQVLKK